MERSQGGGATDHMVAGEPAATMAAAADDGARGRRPREGEREGGVVQMDRELTTRAMAWLVGPEEG